MVVAAVDWTQVLVALIASLPAIIAAVTALHIRQQIQTPSKRSIGKQVEDGVHVGLGNAYRIESVRKATGAERPAEPPTPTPVPGDPPPAP